MHFKGILKKFTSRIGNRNAEMSKDKIEPKFRIYLLVIFISFIINLYFATKDSALSQFNWNLDNAQNLYWANDCDFSNNNLDKKNLSSDQCGNECRQNIDCTHFSTGYIDGQWCWLKYGNVIKENAISKRGITCGILNQISGKILSSIRKKMSS